MASNKVHRSLNRGDQFETISDDLTKGGIKGDVPFGTISTLYESPMTFGLLYAGTDDGLIHVSKDGGVSWQRISDNLPQNLWVARVQASAFQEGRVYAVLNGYRSDDFTAHLYVSEDFGKSWSQLGTDLPLEPLNVVKEDPANQHILYVGSDHGLYVSLNRGQSFMLLNNGLPAVAIHDLVVHPREKELIVGTHGRSLYLARVKELQQLDEKMRAKPIHAFEPDAQRYSPRWGTAYADWAETQEPTISLPVYVQSAGQVTITVQTEKGETLYSMTKSCTPGLNYLQYNLEMDATKASIIENQVNAKLKDDEKPLSLKPAKNGKMYLYRGSYKVVISKDNNQATTNITLK